MIDSLIADYPATLSDEPQTRLMLRSFLAFNRVVLRDWLDGKISRAEAQHMLADTLHALITTVAPKLGNPPPNRVSTFESRFQHAARSTGRRIHRQTTLRPATAPLLQEALSTTARSVALQSAAIPFARAPLLFGLEPVGL